MKRRSTLLSFVAVGVTAFLVAAGGAAYADDVVVDGDTVTTSVQKTIDLGPVNCGGTTSHAIAIWVHRGGNGQVFQGGTDVVLTGTSSNGALTVSPATSTIPIPSGWNASGTQNSGADSDKVTAQLTLAASGAGSATVTFSALGTKSAGDSTKPITGTLSVSWSGSCSTKTDTTTTVSCPATAVYGGSAVEPCTAAVKDVNGVVIATPTVAYSGGHTNVSDSPVTASAAYSGDTTHNGSSGSATFQITPASSATTVTCPASVAYTGDAQTPCTALVTGAGLSQSITPTYTANTDAGTASASATYVGDANHTGSTDSATFTITPAEATCTVSGFAGDYDGTAHGATGSCMGLSGVDLSRGLDLGASFTDVPGGTASWSFASPNYAGQSGTAQIAIDKAASSISLTCADVVYDGTAQEPCHATVVGAGGLSQSLTVEYSDNTNAGTATASASYAGDANHTPTSDEATFAIAKSPTTTTLDCPASVTYTGTALTPCTATTTGGGITEHPAATYQDNTDAGTASASAAYAGDANHESSSDTAMFEIEKAPSSIALDCGSIAPVYTGAAQTPCTATVSGAGMADFTVDVVYTGNTDAGYATASASWDGDANHTGNDVGGGFDIDKAPSTLAVTCPTAAIPFTGSPIEPCTARVTGAGGLDETVSPVTYTANTGVGTATAEAAYAGDANHLSSTDSATFDISAWSLTGFYKPVDMDNALNIVKNGSTVPLKFNVYAGAAVATEITDAATLGARFSATPVACMTWSATSVSDDILATTGGTVLRYDATAKQWVQNWKVPSGAGTCYLVTLKTADGSTLQARFKTK